MTATYWILLAFPVAAAISILWNYISPWLIPLVIWAVFACLLVSLLSLILWVCTL